MATSKVSICNLALLRIGQSRIQSLDEASNEARYCSQAYDPVRRSVLRDHPWSFALKTASLAQLATTPTDYDYSYQMPSDCLKLVRTIGEEADEYDYELREGRMLVTDAESVDILYVFDAEDSAYFDDAFVEALSYRIAADIALPLTGNGVIQSGMMVLYDRALQRARTLDSRETGRSVEFGRSIVDARL